MGSIVSEGGATGKQMLCPEETDFILGGGGMFILTLRVKESSPHHFLHQTNKLHEAAAEFGNLFLHLGHMLLVDLHQRFEGVATVLGKIKRIVHFRFYDQTINLLIEKICSRR